MSKIQNASKTVIRYDRSYGLNLSFINDNGAALEKGMEVKVDGNNLVAERAAGDFPIGYVTVGGADGERVTVRVIGEAVMKAHAKGGTIAAGAFVKPNGTINASGLPEYVAATTGYALAIVITGGAVDTDLDILILEHPVTVA